MMKLKSNDVRARIAALDGSPLAARVALRGMDGIKGEMSQRVTRAKAEQTDSAKQTKRIFAPLLKAITQNGGAADAMSEIQRLAHAEIRRAVKPARAPRFAPVKPQIKGGSIMRFYAPPYDYGYQETVGFGATANAWKNVGEFLAWSNPYSASTGPYSDSAAAGVGIYFRPVAEDSFVRFSPLIKYTYSWRDRSQGGFTAHTSGFLAIRVVSFDLRGGDMRIEQDPRYQVWNDGTGWWETHGDTNQDWPYFPNQQVYFQATSSRQYIIWVWGYTHADDHGDDFAGSGSWSYGWIEPIVVFAVTQEYA